ncbi:17616_t:CDS:2, partial [Gigaspora rosea]
MSSHVASGLWKVAVPLARIEALSKKPEIIKKIKQLRGTKGDDIKRVGDIFETRNVPKHQANTLSNTSGGQETGAVLSVASSA